MMLILFCLLFTLLVKAEWTDCIGDCELGTSTSILPTTRSLICPGDSHIVYIGGGYSSGLLSPKAYCNNGGSTYAWPYCFLSYRWAGKFSNDDGFDSVGVLTDGSGSSEKIIGLSFFYRGDRIVFISSGRVEQTLECPEDEVIMGLEFGCGFYMQGIRLYCGTPSPIESPTQMPTPTPTEIPTGPPTLDPSETCDPFYTWDSKRASEVCSATVRADKRYGVKVCGEKPFWQAKLEKSLANNFFARCVSWCVYDYDTLMNIAMVGATDQGAFHWVWKKNCWSWRKKGNCFEIRENEFQEISLRAKKTCEFQKNGENV